mmetsp:Transcript_67471/g.152616  ORF Transcript_67471/g.152616 Transcript_67471/m.152616 type:complete len:334 (-) Transcript_67471:76-1077(-)
MGGAHSDFARDVRSQGSWLVPHRGLDSPWARFVLRRYGSGFAATGVASSIAVPRLLRRRMQDWTMRGCSVYLGPDFVSFGRELGSLSQTSARLFYGIDVLFGKHNRASWLWYCRSHEWMVQLHKVELEPLPDSPEGTRIGALAENTGTRWPGRPRHLDDELDAQTADYHPSSSAPTDEKEKEVEQSDPGAVVRPAGSPNSVEHQLTFLLSNADGHVGTLSLPVLSSQVDAATAAVQRWSEKGEVPLEWGGRRWSTAQDFKELRETAINMPDLLLMGLETDAAMALTPDWTWEKYPRGFGEVVLPEDVSAREGAAGRAAAEGAEPATAAPPAAG